MVMEQEGSLLLVQDNANPPSFCLLMSPSHLSSLSRTGQGAAALSHLFPVLSSPGCALVRESSPWSVSCPSSEKELHWRRFCTSRLTLLAKPLLVTDPAKQLKGKA